MPDCDGQSKEAVEAIRMGEENKIYREIPIYSEITRSTLSRVINRKEQYLKEVEVDT